MITKGLAVVPAANKYLYHDVDENKGCYRIAMGKRTSTLPEQLPTGKAGGFTVAGPSKGPDRHRREEIPHPHDKQSVGPPTSSLGQPLPTGEGTNRRALRRVENLFFPIPGERALLGALQAPWTGLPEKLLKT